MNAGMVRTLVVAVAVAALVTGCGGSGDDGSADEPATSTTASTIASTTTPPPAADIELLPGDTVLTDAFDDDDNAWIGGFDYTGQPVSAEIADGVLSFAAAEEGGLDLWPDALAGEAMDHVDQRITASVVLTPGGAASVSCRLDPEGEYPKQYSFTLSSAGVYNIGKFDGTSWDRTTLAIDPPEVAEQVADEVPPDDIEYEPVFEFDEEAAYELTGQCVDTDDGVQLAMFVDGELVLSAVDEDDPLEAGLGAVGVEGSSLATGGTFVPYAAVWDDVEFTSIGGAGGDDDEEPETGLNQTVIQGDGSEYCLQETDTGEGFLPLTGEDHLATALENGFDDPEVAALADEHLEAAWRVLPEGGAGPEDDTADCLIYLFDTTASAEAVAEWYIGTYAERGQPPATEAEPSQEAPGDDPHLFTKEIGGRPNAAVVFLYENAIVKVGVTGTSSNSVDAVATAAEKLATLVHERLEAAA